MVSRILRVHIRFLDPVGPHLSQSIETGEISSASYPYEVAVLQVRHQHKLQKQINVSFLKSRW